MDLSLLFITRTHRFISIILWWTFGVIRTDFKFWLSRNRKNAEILKEVLDKTEKIRVVNNDGTDLM